METKLRLLPCAAGAACALSLCTPVWAVNGAQPGGHGAANASMGGASIALPLDAEAAANNPAGLALLPSSMTAGVQVFHGRSSAQYVVPGNELQNRTTTGGPEGGANWRLSPEWSAGMSVAIGGAGANYKQPALPVPGAPNAKSSLEVIEFIPAVAWRPADEFALGLALNLVEERFEAQGVIVPAPVPGGLLPLPVHGHQHAGGVGVRAGALWKPLSELTFGVNVKSRTHMGRLHGYDQDVLAYSNGRIDVPSEYGAGAAWQATPSLLLAADVLQINWGELGLMKDPNGFHWRNQPIERLGAAWKFDGGWTLRAGYSRSRRQITSDRTVQNLLVPSIHNKAFTTGVTWPLANAGSINLGYELDPRTTLHGTGPSSGTSLTSKVQMLFASYQQNF
jgi:long-chain fatty acid transport protein